jgi:hypothetical protein
MVMFEGVQGENIQLNYTTLYDFMRDVSINIGISRAKIKLSTIILSGLRRQW